MQLATASTSCTESVSLMSRGQCSLKQMARAVARPVAKARHCECHKWAMKNGPTWIKEGKACGWKLWVGDLPNDVSKAAIAYHCAGLVDIAVAYNKAPSGAIFAIVTFHDLAAAFKAFEQVAMATFHHGRGQMMWPSVRWARPKAMGTG